MMLRRKLFQLIGALGLAWLLPKPALPKVAGHGLGAMSIASIDHNARTVTFDTAPGGVYEDYCCIDPGSHGYIENLDTPEEYK